MRTFIELCSGCGGLSYGFIHNNFKPLLLNDNDKTCIETLKLNHKNVNIILDDMNNLDLDEYIDKVDVIIGGVPCQSFSMAGKRKGLEDERGKLIYKFIEIILKLNPKCFVIENVKGLLFHNNGETFKKILNYNNIDQFYNIKYKVLNANDYNVPQNRERLFIIGTKNNINIEYEFPKKIKDKPVLNSVLIDCPSSPGIEYTEKKKKLFEYIPEDGCWINLPLDLQKDYLGNSFNSGGGKRGILKRLSMEKPSLTLLTTPSQKQTERCHPFYNRPLQILEYARIQTFPDSFKFYGSLNQKYKQIGNAVPVNLGIYIAKSINDFLNKVDNF